MVVAAQDDLGPEPGKRLQRLFGVGEPVAAGGLAPNWVVVDHDDARIVRSGLLEGFFDLAQVALVDVPYDAEVPEAAREGAARDAVGSVAPGDDRAGYLQGGVELRRDVADVLGILEVVSAPVAQKAEVEVSRDGADPTHVVVAGDDDDGRGLAHRVEVGTGLLELGVRAALREVAGDRDGVRPQLPDQAEQRVQLRGHGGTAEMEVRSVQDPDHEKAVY